MSTELTDAEARKIASEWHDGQRSALYALASTGAMIDGLKDEITGALGAAALYAPRDDLLALRELRAYCEAHHYRRDPVDGWTNLWPCETEPSRA